MTDVLVERGLARCPVCARWVRLAMEGETLAIYHSCQHFRGAWAAQNSTYAMFRGEGGSCVQCWRS